MLRGLYSAASGMQAQRMEQAILAENLANVNTVGYKPSRNTYKSYADQAISNTYTGQEIGGLSRGVAAHSTQFNFNQGPLKPTYNQLDIAINGPGFFPVETSNNQINYTRNGRFTLDANGFLVNQHGERVLDEGFAPVFIGNEGVRDISFQIDGRINLNGRFIGKLGAFVFPNGAQIVKTSGDKFALSNPDLSMTQSQSQFTTFQQGFLEDSTVSAVKAASDLIQVMRGYEANQRVVVNSMETIHMLMDVGRI